MNNDMTLNKNIFWYYRWGTMILPTLLMIFHCIGVVCFHNSDAIQSIFAKGSFTPLVLLYFITAYVMPFALLLPASYFFGHDWVWRIPFAYMLGVVTIRLSYCSLITSVSMKNADCALMFMTAMVYGYWFACRYLCKRHALL